ncbi:CHAD domain-containing protein [bacterium]|nr:CHAD domain-containing protein [bacterium]
MGQHEGQFFTEIAFPQIVHEPLDPSRPFALSAQAIILRFFKEVLDARPRVLANDDIEAVHEIRVAARRTRTALQTFSTLWGDKDVRHWLDYLARVADAFTVARDTDVLIEYLDKQLKGLGAEEQKQRAAALGWLLQRARQRRDEEQPRLEKLLRRGERDHSAAAFVSFFSLKPVDLWQFDQPGPGEAPVTTEEQALAEPDAGQWDEHLSILPEPEESGTDVAAVPEAASPAPESAAPQAVEPRYAEPQEADTQIAEPQAAAAPAEEQHSEPELEAESEADKAESVEERQQRERDAGLVISLGRNPWLDPAAPDDNAGQSGPEVHDGQG